MDSQTIQYLFKAILCSALFLTYYYIFLRNKGFHIFNRFYLLLSITASLILPLLEINLPNFNNILPAEINMLKVIQVDGGEERILNLPKHFNWSNAIFYFLCGISITFSGIWIHKIAEILLLRNKFPQEKYNGCNIIFTDLPEAPYSFFNNIYWRKDIELNEETGRQILKHELVHVKQFHSVDKLFLQLVIIFFWINPFFWILKNELFMVHEFIADEKSIENKSGESFSAMLLHGFFGKTFLSPVQPFFYSPVKRRLTMYLKKQESRRFIFRKLMVVPLVILGLMLFAFQPQKELQVSVSKKFVLAIDAGHGGTDYGAHGLNGLKEKDISLKIAKRIQQLSSDYGIEGILTRKDDIYISPKERVNFVKANKEIEAFVSVHVDISPKTDSSGMAIFIANDNENGFLDQSKLLGSSINASLSKNFKINSELGQRKVKILALQENIVPAVLIECGFINNKNDVKILNDEKRIDEIAKNILKGVAVYANNVSVTGSK